MESTLIFLTIVGTLILAEIILYLGMSEPYYRLGPAVWRRSWLVHLTPGDVLDRLSTVISGTKMNWQVHGNGMIAFRRPWYEFSTYPRLTLSVELVGDRTSVTWRIKPFVSPILALPLPLLDYMNVAPSGPNPWLLWLAIGVLAAYAYFFAWELHQLRKLEWLHRVMAQMEAEPQILAAGMIA